MKFRNTAGKIVDVPEGFTYGWRPAVYGFLVHEGKLLFIQPNWDTKYCLPGGSMDLGEDPITALEREILEETGYRIEVVDPRPMFVDSMLYGDPSKDKYFQRLNFFYEVKFIGKVEGEIDEESQEILWREVEVMKVEDFTHFQRDFLRKVL